MPMEISITVKTNENFTNQENLKSLLDMVQECVEDQKNWRTMDAHGQVNIEGSVEYTDLVGACRADYTMQVRKSEDQF